MNQQNVCIIITGLSGAGKSYAANCLEDLGYFCIDNLPFPLIPKFAELCVQSKEKKFVLVLDIRGGEDFRELFANLQALEENNFSYQIIFLEAKDEVLIRRYSETRRSHPLKGRLSEAITAERNKLWELREKASRIIDTSNFTWRDLKEEMATLVVQGEEPKKLVVSIISFGFKYGIPLDADLVFDVRFLPNPNYVESLQHLTGMDEDTQNYLFGFPQTQEFTEKLFSFIEFTLPHYIKEGKAHLTIAVGCTGGRHRSVAIANALYEELQQKKVIASVYHRDFKKRKD